MRTIKLNADIASVVSVLELDLTRSTLPSYVVHKKDQSFPFLSVQVAIFLTSNHVLPVFISVAIILLHVSCSWPHLLPPCSVHLSAVLVFLDNISNPSLLFNYCGNVPLSCDWGWSTPQVFMVILTNSNNPQL